jgi:excisionase family DNA binding protein
MCDYGRMMGTMQDESSPPRETAGSGRKEPLITVPVACDYIKCTRRYLARMVASGRLRALKPSRKLIRFRQSDLDAFLESSATGGRSQ